MGILWAILFLGIMLAVGIYNYGSLFKEAGCGRLGLVVMVIFCICGVPSFLAVMNFVAAEPADLIRASGYDIPPDWTAGVMNHGSYSRWYLIEDHPLYFALSIIGLAVSVISLQALLLYATWKRRKNRSAQSDEITIAPEPMRLGEYPWRRDRT